MAKERIRLIYPENPIWVGHEWEKGTSNSDGWFSKIRDMVRDHIASKRLAAGKTIKRKTLPIARKVCGDCIAFHLKQGSIFGVEKAVSTPNALLHLPQICITMKTYSKHFNTSN